MNSITKFGVINGVCLLIGFYGSHLVLGTDPDNYAMSEVVGYSVMLLCAVAIVLGIRDFREQRKPQPTGFLACLGAGTGMAVIAGLFFGVYNFVYITVINPSFSSEYQAYYEEQIRASGLPPAEIEQQLAQLAASSELFANDYFNSFVMFMTVFLIGLLFALVGAAALKTSTNTSTTA